MTPIIIGIAGGSGSGKTTVVKRILEALTREEVAIISQDSYYRDNRNITLEAVSYTHLDVYKRQM